MSFEWLSVHMLAPDDLALESAHEINLPSPHVTMHGLPKSFAALHLHSEYE